MPLKACGAPLRTLRAAIRAGELPAVKVGREYQIRRTDLGAWLQARQVKPRPKPEVEESEADRAIARARRSGALRSVPTRAA